MLCGRHTYAVFASQSGASEKFSPAPPARAAHDSARACYTPLRGGSPSLGPRALALLLFPDPDFLFEFSARIVLCLRLNRAQRLLPIGDQRDSLKLLIGSQGTQVINLIFSAAADLFS